MITHDNACRGHDRFDIASLQRWDGVGRYIGFPPPGVRFTTTIPTAYCTVVLQHSTVIIVTVALPRHTVKKVRQN